ncbi:MAG: wax ester/triacylglycerol synthase family O-acyltransferase [Aeromicrobium sp.]|nr:wax ester/triacylglycerol synthase family O-acyltransferase [Aeromicrobium sp.]
MDRLSGLDASFLYLESSAQLMHVCGLIVVDPATIPGGYDFEEFKQDLARRVSGIAMFNRKLKLVPGRIDFPVWVTDDDFDIDRHVHRLAVPAPGGDGELSEVAGHLAGIPLDRTRPLWEMHVIEGMANGQIVVFSKMHHSSVDGVSGSNMISYLCSLEPDAPPLDPGTSAANEHLRAPSDLELVGRAVVTTIAKPWRFAKLGAPTVRALVESASRARQGTAMAAPLTAPRTSFNGTITGHRSIAFGDVSLDDIRAIKNAVPGATVNDVVLALSGGALRRYLRDRGELPATSLLASVPVSVRSESTKTGGRNKVSSIFCRLGTDVEDPLERITAMSVANAHAKDHHKAVPADTLQEWAEFAAPRTFGLAVRMVSDLRLAEKAPVIHNLVISNVPGPPVPLYFMGARIDALYALGPVFHGAGLNITVMSNNGEMHIGAIACRELAPRVWDLVDQFPIELKAMKKAVLGG